MAITGAAGLIGSVLTSSFLASGAVVHAVDIDRAGLEMCSERAAAEGNAGRLRCHVCDLGDPEAIALLADALEPLDVIVANVGWNDDRRGLTALDAQSWRRVLDVNLVGPALLCSALTSRLEASDAAAIVFVTSVNADEPSPWLHYAAAKAGLAKLTVDMAHDLLRVGIRVNAIAPGRVVAADAPADERAKHPDGLGGGAVPVEAIVHAVMFFADSQRSPMTTGQYLMVTGAPGRGGLPDR